MLLWSLAAMAQQPWQIGPSPSASDTESGLAFAAHTTFAGRPEHKGGNGRVTAAFGAGRRFWFSGEVARGTSWRTCPSCDAIAFDGTARVLAIDTSIFNGAVWGGVSATPNASEGSTGAPMLTAGLAFELDLGRVAFDTSIPVFASSDPWDQLWSSPELGARFAWTKRNTTRVALVGFDPHIGLTHRLRFGIFGFEVTARTSDAGPLVEGGLRLQL